VRDLPLLFGCLVKFRGFVVPQASPESVQDFRRRFVRGTDNKDAVESPLVSAIAFRQRNLYIFARGVDPSLLFS
jgi:hypothetical protein